MFSDFKFFTKFCLNKIYLQVARCGHRSSVIRKTPEYANCSFLHASRFQLPAFSLFTVYRSLFTFSLLTAFHSCQSTH